MERARYIVVEGPAGAGKTALAQKLAISMNAKSLLEEVGEVPFPSQNQENLAGYAFQVQMFYLMSRFNRLRDVAQLDLFQRGTVGDFLFDRDRLYGLSTLKENEFALYDQIFTLLRERTPQPDLVIFLSYRTGALWRRLKLDDQTESPLNREKISELVEAYNYFFFHYLDAPLLMVNASDVDLVEDDENYARFLKVVRGHRAGVKHYTPLSVNPGGPRREE